LKASDTVSRLLEIDTPGFTSSPPQVHHAPRSYSSLVWRGHSPVLQPLPATLVRSSRSNPGHPVTPGFSPSGHPSSDVVEHTGPGQNEDIPSRARGGSLQYSDASSSYTSSTHQSSHRTITSPFSIRQLPQPPDYEAAPADYS